MRILCIADEVDKKYWDYYKEGAFDGIDLVISCGDLDRNYLEFIVTMAHCPVLYVHGNHDTRYDFKPPEGCICIEDKIYNYKGLRILGLGGSQKYRNAAHMYTEGEMKRRIGKAAKDILFCNGIDLLVTHASARGYGDMDDLAHMGFSCFNDALDKYHPVYMVHGHVHKEYSAYFKRIRNHPSGTTIVNVCGSYLLDISEDQYPAEGKTGSFIYDLVISMQKNKKRGRYA